MQFYRRFIRDDFQGRGVGEWFGFFFWEEGVCVFFGVVFFVVVVLVRILFFIFQGKGVGFLFVRFWFRIKRGRGCF